MRLISLLGAGALISQTAAAESIRAETCVNGADVRVIEVLSPGTVGLACDVVYTRDGGANVAVPYNANVDKDFCRARASELASKLIADGFECSTSTAQSLEASLAGGEPVMAKPESAEVPAAMPVDAAPVAAIEDAPLDVQLKQLAGAETQADPVEALAQPQPAAVAEAPAAELTEPAQIDQEPTPAEPIHLAADARTSEYRAPRPPKTTGPGRLIGAPPEQVSSSIDDIVDVSTAPKPTQQASAQAKAPDVPARSTDEIVRSVLTANAAAWNEGNFDAYMGGYANTADLTMVKDTAVATGWREVRKALEKDIAANGGMGRLAFDNVEVSVTSADVATIVGNYAVTNGDKGSSGVMTLVMKQIDGHWRIVQDTRIAAGTLKP